MLNKFLIMGIVGYILLCTGIISAAGSQGFYAILAVTGLILMVGTIVSWANSHGY